MTQPNDDPYLERFQTHGIHAQLEQSRDLISRLLAGGTVQSEPQLGRLRRLERGIAWVTRMLSSVDGSLVGVPQLNELNSALSQIAQHLVSFTNQSNDGYLVTANDLLDGGLIPLIYRLPRIENPADVGPIFAALDTERNRAEALLQALEDQRVQTLGNYNRIIQDERRVDEQIAKQEERLNVLVQRTDESISQFNTRAAEAESARSETVTNAIAALTRDLEQYRSATREDLGRYREQLVRDAETVISDLKKYKDDAASLLNVIGEVGVAAPFDNTARKDRWAALWLRVLAGVFFTGMVITVVATAFRLVDQGMALEYMIFRFLTALIFVVPAYYFARESSKFMDEADRNRRRQLELASIGPFIQSLEPLKKAAIIEELTRKYFNADLVSRELEKPVDLKAVIDLAMEALKRAK